MSQTERYGTRDQSYSAWHRMESTKRYVGASQARQLSMIDLDAYLYVEYENGDREPIALMETAMDVGQARKPATVTRNLAKRANLPAFTVLYSLSQERNPADPQYQDIAGLRVQRLWPEPSDRWTRYSPKEWAEFLLALREAEEKKIALILGVGAKKKGRRIHSLSEFRELWPAVLMRCRRKIGLVAVAYLHDAEPVAVTDEEAVLEFKKAYHFESACDSARLTSYEKIFNECFDHPRKLVFRLSPTTPEMAEPEYSDDDVDVVEMAKQLFAAEVVQ